MAEIAQCRLSEDAVDRQEMREIVVSLSKLVTYSTEWEASLGGNSQVFSGLFNGRWNKSNNYYMYMVWLTLKCTITFFFSFDNSIVKGEESKPQMSLLETLGGLILFLIFDNMIE